MVKNLIHFVSSILLIIVSVMVMGGCESNNYQFGDITRRIDSMSYNYCTETNPETRAVLRAALNGFGVKVDVDYCAAYSLKTVIVGGGSG